MAQKINYQSDFDFILRLVDCRGEEMGIPDYDWEARLYTTSKSDAFVASCTGGEYVNCYNDNGQIHIVCDGHHLSSGTLKCEFIAQIPNGIYPDEYEKVVVPAPLDIELVRGVASCPHGVDIELILPYIKGDAFTFEDFTPEQLADLQRPAVEAAERADKATQDAISATKNVTSATDSANQAATRANEAAKNAEDNAAEAERINTTISAHEEARIEAEASRKGAEEARVTAESDRDKAEQERDAAEKSRVSAESTRATAENQRVQTENDRVSAEETRVKNEASRNAAEEKRVKAEDARVSEFSTIKTDADTAIKAATKAAEDANIAVGEIPENLVAYHIMDENGEGEENEEGDASRKRPPQSFIDEWNVAAGDTGCFNEVTGFFELNGINDIPYEEAIEIMNYAQAYPSLTSMVGSQCRTNMLINPKASGNALNSITTTFAFASPNLEVVRVANTPTSMATVTSASWGMFCNASGLRKVIGILDISKLNGSLDSLLHTTFGLANLEDISVHNLSKDTNFFVMSKNLSIESLRTLINNAANTKPISFTVHPDIYRKITIETDEEWNSLLNLAVEKNILIGSI